MPVYRLKNLILLILAIAVGFLLALVVPKQLARTHAQQHLQQQLDALFAGSNVTLDCNLPNGQKLSVIELQSPDSYDELAEKLLGEGCCRDGDFSDPVRYVSENGTLEISGDGSFCAKLQNSPVSTNLEKSAASTLRQLGFSASQVLAPERLQAGVFAVCCRQSVLSMPIFSDGLTLCYTNNRLSEISGTYYQNTAGALRVGDEKSISCADALLALRSRLDELGWVGSRITAVTQGFRRIDSASAAIRLAPYWKIDTDTGSFFVSGIGGEVFQID